MGYGDTFHCKALSAFDLADFAHWVALPATLVARELTAMARQGQRLAISLAQDTVYTEEEHERVWGIAAFVTRQADRLVRIAPQVPKVDSALL